MILWNVWNGIFIFVCIGLVDIQFYLFCGTMFLNLQDSYCSFYVKIRNSNCGCKGYLLSIYWK